MQKTVASVTLAFMLAGCATQPANVTPAYVSSMKYEGQDCKRLKLEAEEVEARLQAVTGTLQSKANTDAVLMGVGLLLFWPALLALPATGGKAEEMELAKLKGESAALQQTIKTRCTN